MTSHKFGLTRQASTKFLSIQHAGERLQYLRRILRGEAPGVLCSVCGLTIDEVCRCGALEPLQLLCMPRPLTLRAGGRHVLVMFDILTDVDPAGLAETREMVGSHLEGKLINQPVDTFPVID